MFIALEGIDGSGTTTQAKALTEGLISQGISATCTAQPSDGRMGQLAREMLGEPSPASAHRRPCLALTFAADRLDHYDRVLAPALARGETVICDRYLLSSWVYQSLDLPLAWVQELNHYAPWPDLTLVLDLDPKIAHDRVKARKGPTEIYDRLELQRSLAERYQSLATAHADRQIELVPADAPIEDLTETLLQKILERRAQLA